MTKPNSLWFFLSTISVLCLAIACGGGGSGSSIASTSISGTGTGGTSLSKVNGSIDQFGSVYVGGVHFNTDDVQTTFDGLDGNFDDLELGMWITVEGTISSDGLTGTATNLIFETHLAGSVESVLAANTIVLQDVTVEIDDRTQLSLDLSLPISVNQDLRLTGQYTTSGNFWASHIGPHNGEDIKLDRSRIQASTADDGSFTTLWVELEREDGELIWEFEDFDIDFSDAEELFQFNRNRREGDRLLVRGRLNDDLFEVDSYLDWGESELEDEHFDETFGVIDDIDLSSQQITIDDTTYSVKPFTVFRDESDRRNKKFGLKQLDVGDFIYIEFNPISLVLIRVERDDFEGDEGEDGEDESEDEEE